MQRINVKFSLFGDILDWGQLLFLILFMSFSYALLSCFSCNMVGCLSIFLALLCTLVIKKKSSFLSKTEKTTKEFYKMENDRKLKLSTILNPKENTQQRNFKQFLYLAYSRKKKVGEELQ